MAETNLDSEAVSGLHHLRLVVRCQSKSTGVVSRSASLRVNSLTRMVYPRSSVELAPDPVPGEHRTDRKVPPAQELVDRPPYLAELAPRPARRDARLERHVCHAHELAALFVLPSGAVRKRSWTSKDRTLTTSPTRKVREVSPWKPSRYAVTSTFTISPSWSGRLGAATGIRGQAGAGGRARQRWQGGGSSGSTAITAGTFRGARRPA